MTPKQARFVQEYMVDLNGTQAAIRAGYSEKTAQEIASENLSKPIIASAIESHQADRAANVGIDAEWVLRRYKLLANFNIRKFLTVHPNGRAYYDFANATDDDWYCISEYTAKTIATHNGPIPVDEVKLKAYDKSRALEMIGKHVNVQAFKERVDHAVFIQVQKVERRVIDVTPLLTDV